jgi:hypothetical protein
LSCAGTRVLWRCVTPNSSRRSNAEPPASRSRKKIAAGARHTPASDASSSGSTRRPSCTSTLMTSSHAATPRSASSTWTLISNSRRNTSDRSSCTNGRGVRSLSRNLGGSEAANEVATKASLPPQHYPKVRRRRARSACVAGLRVGGHPCQDSASSRVNVNDHRGFSRRHRGRVRRHHHHQPVQLRSHAETAAGFQCKLMDGSCVPSYLGRRCARCLSSANLARTSGASSGQTPHRQPPD